MNVPRSGEFQLTFAGWGAVRGHEYLTAPFEWLVIFQMAEVAIARQMFQEILRLIAELRPQPPPALA